MHPVTSFVVASFDALCGACGCRMIAVKTFASDCLRQPFLFDTAITIRDTCSMRSRTQGELLNVVSMARACLQVGTLNYMSPEAIIGGSQNCRGGAPLKVRPWAIVKRVSVPHVKSIYDNNALIYFAVVHGINSAILVCGWSFQSHILGHLTWSCSISRLRPLLFCA